MKTAFVLMMSFVASAAFAKPVFVNDNVFTASGPATPAYHTNLGQISAAFKKVSDLELGRLKFAGASVNADAGTIQYQFHQILPSESRTTCWAQLSFTAKTTATGPVVSDVKADKACFVEQD